MIFTAGYAVVVGDNWNWNIIRAWGREHPKEPLVGLRVDAQGVWVVCQHQTASGSLSAATVEAIRRLFEAADEQAWTDDCAVFLCNARSLGAGHRLARAVIRMLGTRTQERK